MHIIIFHVIIWLVNSPQIIIVGQHKIDSG